MNNIVVTRAAEAHISRILPKNATVTLSLKKAGCAGAMYRLQEAEPQPGDILQEFGQFTLSVPAEDAAALSGTVIDCLDDGAGTRITFSNPREKARCGCGMSVDISA